MTDKSRTLKNTPKDKKIIHCPSLFPGPGAYNPAKRDKHGNMLTGKDQRFHDRKTDVPGPGAYEVSFKIYI